MSVKMDDAIAGYIKLRDALEALKKVHSAKEALLAERMAKLEAFFLDFLNKSGSDNLAVRGVGTIFKQDVHSVSIQDWDATLAWIQENNAWEFLERRIAKSAVKEFAEANNQLPPGVHMSTAVEVRIRKS